MKKLELTQMEKVNAGGGQCEMWHRRLVRMLGRESTEGRDRRFRNVAMKFDAKCDTSAFEY